MSNRVLQVILIVSSILILAVFFIYRSFGWPLGREGIEASIAFIIFFVSACAYSFYLHRKVKKDLFQENVVKIGLFVGLLWTAEICMNNILRPELPMRDVYDDLFWVAVASIIFSVAAYYGFRTKSINKGIQTGFWSGLASGAVAGMTALIFIVFGMNQILLDPLNISEWIALGSSSGAPSIAVYFAYQTLAGAVMHFIILGIVMGTFLGVLAGIVGKGIRLAIKK